MAPRVQWLFVAQTTRNAIMETKYIEINSVHGRVHGLFRCNPSLPTKRSVED
jgi:hypothetical protein